MFEVSVIERGRVRFFAHIFFGEKLCYPHQSFNYRQRGDHLFITLFVAKSVFSLRHDLDDFFLGKRDVVRQSLFERDRP